jgi:hypothetical protein
MRNMIGLIAKSGARAAAAAALLVVSTGAASAATTISSNAADLKVSLSLLGITPSITLGTSSGSGSNGYSDSGQVLGVTKSLGLGGLLGETTTTGLMTTSATSDGTTGSANAMINGLNLNLGTLLLTTFGLTSGTISSTTTFDGTSLFGVSNIANLAVSSQTMTIPINASALLSSDVNRTLVDIAGLKVTLNEQIAAGDITNNIYTRSLTTNALHVAYKDFAFGGGLLSGDVIVGQSAVSVSQAVPEPATWAMMIVGFGLVGGVLRSQRRRPAHMIA